MSAVRRAVTGLAALSAGTVAYGSLIERNAWTVRSFDVPVLEPGSTPMRVLHITDLHITPPQRRKQDWIRSLADLQPDLVINTGDTLSAMAGIPAVMHSLEPLFAFPGAFVPGNNDYYDPTPRNPMRYFSPGVVPDGGRPLPWPELARAMVDSGWADLTHVRTKLAAAGQPVALAGTDDPQLNRARYELISGRADRAAAVRIGVTHSPEPLLLGDFAADGYDLVLAGHTHGGQVRVPFGPAIVTNCGIDRRRARWLHAWDDTMYFHVSAGVGTGPYSPLRLACRPEASLLTLLPRPAGGGTGASGANATGSRYGDDFGVPADSDAGDVVTAGAGVGAGNAAGGG